MFTWIGIVLCGVFAGPLSAHAGYPYDYNTCEEFERGARFVPYEIVDSMWKIFYFWSNNTEIDSIIFSIPATKVLQKFKAVVDTIDPHFGVEWHKASLLMEPRPGVQVLLLYAGTVGAFRALVKIEDRTKARPIPQPLIRLADVRMKVVDRYLGMMSCEELSMFAMARVNEVPVTEEECQVAASKLGFRGEGGRSYLYIMKLMRGEEL